MSRKSRLFDGTLAIAALAAGALAFQTTNVLAVSSDPPPKPRPKLDCSKPENKGKAACANKRHELSDDELFYAGYWLARKGDFKLALHYLGQAKSTTDPRIITYIGYSHRKLGHWDVAMGHYARALAINPDFVVARGYLGEAFVERGEHAKAAEQLDEIAKRCGTTCEEYKTLAGVIAKAAPKG